MYYCNEFLMKCWLSNDFSSKLTSSIQAEDMIRFVIFKMFIAHQKSNEPAFYVNTKKITHSTFKLEIVTL